MRRRMRCWLASCGANRARSVRRPRPPRVPGRIGCGPGSTFHVKRWRSARAARNPRASELPTRVAAGARSFANPTLHEKPFPTSVARRRLGRLQTWCVWAIRAKPAPILGEPRSNRSANRPLSQHDLLRSPFLAMMPREARPVGRRAMRWLRLLVSGANLRVRRDADDPIPKALRRRAPHRADSIQRLTVSWPWANRIPPHMPGARRP